MLKFTVDQRFAVMEKVDGFRPFFFESEEKNENTLWDLSTFYSLSFMLSCHESL